MDDTAFRCSIAGVVRDEASMVLLLNWIFSSRKFPLMET